MTIFADDNTWICRSTNKSNLMKTAQVMFYRFTEWFNCNRLFINKEKTLFIIFASGGSVIAESSWENVNTAGRVYIIFGSTCWTLTKLGHLHWYSLWKFSAICCIMSRLRDLYIYCVILYFFYKEIRMWSNFFLYW